MKDYFKWLGQQTQVSSGGAPRIRDYVAVKLVENFFPIILVGIVVLAGGIGLFVELPADRNNWALNAASLALGVFLGLFTGKKV